MSLEFANRRSSHNVDCEAAYLAQERREGRAVAPAATTASPPARTADGKPWWGVTAEKRAELKRRGEWDAYVKRHPHLAFYDTGVSP